MQFVFVSFRSFRHYVTVSNLSLGEFDLGMCKRRLHLLIRLLKIDFHSLPLHSIILLIGIIMMIMMMMVVMLVIKTYNNWLILIVIRARYVRSALNRLVHDSRISWGLLFLWKIGGTRVKNVALWKILIAY